MSQYYLDTLKKSLADPTITGEGLQQIVQESQFFFDILRVKLESKDPELQKQAVQEILELKSLLLSKSR